MKLNALTAHELLDKLKSKKITAAEILADLKSRYEEVELKLMAFAREPFFQKASSGEMGSGELAGIPVVIKDNICKGCITLV